MTLPEEERRALLALAREALESYVLRRSRPKAVAEGILAEQRGCFVTLTHNEALRGCIGTFQPQSPLAQTIVEMARAAARDPRFVLNPITAGELPRLRIEISLLSPLKRTEHPEQLEIGVDGIYIIRGGRSGCFLPEVATDYGMGPEEFLDSCCEHKAGLPRGAWRLPETEVYLFTSEKFGE